MPSHCALRVLEKLAVGTGLLLWIWDLGGGWLLWIWDLGESDCVALGATITVGESGSRRCGRASLGEFGLCKWQAWHKHLLGESSSCPTTDSKMT